MAGFTRTWWGQHFIHALEQFADQNRLARGRSYANNGKIQSFTLKDGKITAKVRGSINPYFGVYKEPLYDVSIACKPICAADWDGIIKKLASNAAILSRLLLNEVPEEIDSHFKASGSGLLPQSFKDFQVKCSCPDFASPCKHIAGVCYLFAAELDENPFLLFEMRGLTRPQLQAELRKTSLGRALASGLEEDQQNPPQPVSHYYTTPQALAVDPQINDLRAFWQGSVSLPEIPPANPEQGITGILIKKQGDYPAFWNKDSSFIAVMDALYQRVHKHKTL